ncbi:transposase [Ensifer aridi]|uniref:transposase n=1 Tax=Ensifer aridi TaxID=1708715 RepID=UPI00041E801D|nr:transposase [Ensifer aridi]
MKPAVTVCVRRGGATRTPAGAALPTPTAPAEIDQYLPFVQRTLETYPDLTASRLYGMVQERGYKGSSSHFRHMLALHPPRKAAEAFLRLRTLPGEQDQVDWAHFGHIEIGKARRPLMAFVMVLSYSRDIYLRFFLDARMENFLRGYAGAFNAWNGLPRVLQYDDLKSAVLEHQGDAIRFHPTLLAFAGHYRFVPSPWRGATKRAASRNQMPNRGPPNTQNAGGAARARLLPIGRTRSKQREFAPAVVRRTTENARFK